ncbi:MAG: flagellar motor protein MotB [Eubacteriales bacterium]|nr:flagellar motor protein MotB [Eubacteriales bacterium]
MAKKKPEEAPAGSPAWMATFSDLMNLLLCFFVLLFSMSTVDAQKFEEIAASLSSSFSILPSGGSALSTEGILVSSGASQLNDLSTQYNNMGLNTEGDFSEEVQSAQEEVEKEGLEESESMAEHIEKILEIQNVSDQVEVTATSKYVMLNLSGGVLFESGKADLTPEAVSLLDSVSVAIKQYDDNTITIEGHTDSNPINTAKFPNNMMLSLYRAYSVFDYFVNSKGFSEQSMTSSGRGDAVPIASNSTAEGRAQNRRVEIKIYNKINS